MAYKLPETLIFLGRSSLSVFVPKNKFAKTLNIPETVMRDLELVDADLFGNLLRDFVEKEKIEPSTSLVVASDAISFTCDIPVSEENKKGILVQDFVDSVPLEAPEVKVFREGEVNKAVAVNPKYYRVLVETLKTKGFFFLGVIPALVIPEVRTAPAINLEIAKKVLDEFEKIKFQSFIDVTSADMQDASQSIITTQAPKGPRIWILVGVFVLMIVIFLAMLLLRK